MALGLQDDLVAWPIFYVDLLREIMGVTPENKRSHLSLHYCLPITISCYYYFFNNT